MWTIFLMIIAEPSERISGVSSSQHLIEMNCKSACQLSFFICINLSLSARYHPISLSGLKTDSHGTFFIASSSCCRSSFTTTAWQFCARKCFCLCKWGKWQFTVTMKFAEDWGDSLLRLLCLPSEASPWHQLSSRNGSLGRKKEFDEELRELMMQVPTVFVY